jgi:hypothetical protein
MKNLHYCFVLFLILLNTTLTQTANKPDPSAFACGATSFTPLDDSYGQTVVISPDQKKHISLNKDGSFGIFVGQKQIGSLTYDVSADVEAGWSPDSTQFFIMYSDSGSIGGFHAHLFSIQQEEKIAENRMTQIAFDDFKQQHYCPTRGNNLFFLAWTNDSRRVFLVSEVFPTSDCGKEMSRFGGYLMDVDSARIIRRYSEAETTTIEKSCRTSGKLRL